METVSVEKEEDAKFLAKTLQGVRDARDDCVTAGIRLTVKIGNVSDHLSECTRQCVRSFDLRFAVFARTLRRETTPALNPKYPFVRTKLL